MKIYLLCFAILLFLAVNGQPSSQSAREALDAKVAAVNITNFFFLLGNEDGVFYTYQKGSVSNTTILPVASASKWVSSVVFNMLINNGTLSFMDQPQDYIDWWTSDPDIRDLVFVVRSHARFVFEQRLDLTFKSISSALTQLPKWIFNPPRLRISTNHGLVSKSKGLAEISNLLNSEECVKLIYNSSSFFEPGKSFIYSENHMHILGLMAVKKTGKTYQQIFTSTVKESLGLTTSIFLGSNARPSSSLSTTVVEYEKILRSIYLKTILPADVIDMMEQDQTNVSITLSPATEYNVGWHYALGHWVECPYERFEPSCLTDIFRRSSPGGLGYYPWIDRKMNYYGILATKETNGIDSALQVDSFRDKIHALLAAVRGTPYAEPTNSPSSAPSNSPSDSSTSPKGLMSGSIRLISMAQILSLLLLGIILY